MPHSGSKNTTRTNSQGDGYDGEEEEEFNKFVEELKDDDKPEIKFEIGEYMGEDGNGFSHLLSHLNFRFLTLKFRKEK